MNIDKDIIRENYYKLLQENLINERVGDTRPQFKMFIRGYACAIGMTYEELDEKLEKSMLSDHFIKQQLNFHNEQELFEITEKFLV